jgi:hypothetical protein
MSSAFKTPLSAVAIREKNKAYPWSGAINTQYMSDDKETLYNVYPTWDASLSLGRIYVALPSDIDVKKSSIKNKYNLCL